MVAADLTADLIAKPTLRLEEKTPKRADSSQLLRFRKVRTKNMGIDTLNPNQQSRAGTSRSSRARSARTEASAVLLCADFACA